MPTLDDCVAVITEGACGVGRGVARALARDGARVYITGRSAPDGATEDGITAIRCDHCEETDVLTAFARVTQETQGIDLAAFFLDVREHRICVADAIVPQRTPSRPS